MKRLNLTQGSAEWHAHRASARNASEVSAVLGCSPYMTRSDLLQARHTGIRPEPTRDQARRFADGHSIEALQRPGAARVIGEELYPVVGSDVVDSLELSASFDGLTMAEDIAYECKTLNDDLRAVLPYESDAANEGNARSLPKHYRAQMEQQLMVCGGERVLFVAATRDGSDVRRCWYYPDPALRAEIVAAWKQFDADLAAYVPPAGAAVVVAAPVQALPAVSVQVTGSIAVVDNFGKFETALRDFLEHRLIRQPKTDQDFADLDVQIKAMKGAEAALKCAEAQMLAQIASVDEAKKTKDMLLKLVADNRKLAEGLLTSEKERRRGEIVAGGVTALKEHIHGLNQRIGRPYMPVVPADFGGAIKGKSNLAKMEDAVATELARAKIAANEIADRIQTNLRTIDELAADFPLVIPDRDQLVLKAPDDCRAVISSRIAEHQAREHRRLEQERERIRAEEAARADREAQERAAAERRQQEEAARAAAPPPTPAPTAAPAPAPVANVVPMQRPTAAPASPPTLRLGQINERIAPLSIDAAGLAALGFPHSATDKAAKLYHEHQFHGICAAIAQHAVAAANRLQAA